MTIIPVEGLPELAVGDDLGALVAGAAALEDRDVLVIAQKAVSKAEGRVVRLADVVPSERAHELAAGGDPRQTEVVLRETARIVRTRPPLIIAETRHGFVCAAAGVDASNAPEPATVVLLPVDPDASAQRVRERILELTGRDVGVVVSDTFGRPFRFGIAGVAIGVAGIRPLLDLRGARDRAGYLLRVTVIAVADEIASAAELALGKVGRRPVAIVRGAAPSRAEATIAQTLIPAESDLFR